MKIAIVRGKYLNPFEMQYYEPLVKKHDLTGFSSLKPLGEKFAFPVVKLPSPMDLPDFPYKMPVLNRLFIDAQYLFGLEKKLKGFEIAHSAETYMHFTQQCLEAKRRGWVKKVVATVSENIPFNNEGIRGRKRFKKRAILELDQLIAISQKAKEALLLEGCPEKKINVIGHHINTDRFKPKPIFKKDFKNIKILFVGRLEQEKGVEEIIMAARKLAQDRDLQRYRLEYLLVGSGKERNNLLKFVERLGIKNRFFWRESAYLQMPSFYQQADILLAPSRPTRYWQEQFGMVLLEAMASRLPIITTNSGAIPETVGSAAILVPPADFLALADAIKKLVLQPKLRLEMGIKARQRAVKLFDYQLGAQKLAQVYEKVSHYHC
jgi:glycosyltransferase involved in cell wall biosynthesis